MGILFAILIFSIVVIIHELGHFLFAKWNGIHVFEFSLGMGPTLLKKQYGETLYCLKMLPLGGSCMMGEDGEHSVEPDDDRTAESETKVNLRIGNFNEKSVWARISVIFGGPLFNFILALICAVIMVGWIGYDAPTIGYIADGSAAEESGMLVGDRITKLGDKNINLWREVTTYLQVYPTDELEVEFIRDDVKYSAIINPRYEEESGRQLMGIAGDSYIKGTFIENIRFGAYTVKYYMLSVIDSLKMMISGMVSMDQVSGPVGIVDQVGQTYEASVEVGWDAVLLNMIHLIVLLSANLGVMNLLPIPALDGGRLVFLIIEAISGKRVPAEKEGMIHFIGFAALMLFMGFIMFHDIMRLFN